MYYNSHLRYGIGAITLNLGNSQHIWAIIRAMQRRLISVNVERRQSVTAILANLTHLVTLTVVIGLMMSI